MADCPPWALQVTPLADISDRSRAGRRCFEHVIMCSPQGIFNQPANGSWLNGTLPFATGQQVQSCPRPMRRCG